MQEEFVILLPPIPPMAESEQVKLHGHWALKLKGVKYEYIEEDLSNKSPSLLDYNPIHKKVPVLVHGGKPVVESALILQYIDETWPDRTPLLPKDPYQRAIARFWRKKGKIFAVCSSFIELIIDDKFQVPTFAAFFLTSEEDKEKTAREVAETLRMIQDEALGDKRFFGGDSLSLVDLAFGWLANSFQAMEEAVGTRVLEPKTLPRLHKWTVDFKQEALIKESLPDTASLFQHFERVRKRRLTSPAKN